MPCPSCQTFQASSGMAMATFSPLSEKCNDHEHHFLCSRKGMGMAMLTIPCCLKSGKRDGHNYHLLLPLIRHGHSHDFQATLCKATMSFLFFLIRAIADNQDKRGRGRERCHVHFQALQERSGMAMTTFSPLVEEKCNGYGHHFLCSRQGMGMAMLTITCFLNGGRRDGRVLAMVAVSRQLFGERWPGPLQQQQKSGRK